ncbi:MAG: hypothetical protein ACFFC3_16685 [Candidatus Odinarchaeota archaeon]
MYIKSLPLKLRSTEEFALEILNDSKYEKFPQYVNKNQIQKAFNEFGSKLNPYNSAIYSSSLESPNIEGHFLSTNIPEIESVIINKAITEKNINEIIDKSEDITHIGLSVYAHRLDNAIKIIKIIKKDYPEKELFIGGTGAMYSRLNSLIHKKNICTGNGIVWLRKKFGLPQLRKEEYKISTIIMNTRILPVNIKTAYMVTQVGCPYNCDFCITAKLLHYCPFSNSQNIIKSLVNLLEMDRRDKFLYLCEPNACFPEREWYKVFDFFTNYKGTYDNYLYIICLISLNHLGKFNLKLIQENCRVKFLLANFGIESTLKGGYEKNRGVSKNFVQNLSNLGIITNHNFILGLPHHTHENIELEIKRNLEYNSNMYFVSTLKPLPPTYIYELLKREGRLFGDDLPAELVYEDGFFPFKHQALGGGFSALHYAFKAYHEVEKKIIDVYSNMAETLSKSPIANNSRYLRKIIRALLTLSNQNFKLFEPRMPETFSIIYRSRLEILTKNLQ